jgi:hypothetical protein
MKQVVEGASHLTLHFANTDTDTAAAHPSRRFGARAAQKSMYPAAGLPWSGFKLGLLRGLAHATDYAAECKRPADNERPLLLSAQAITHHNPYHKIHLPIV